MPGAVRRALYLFVASFVLHFVMEVVALRYPEAQAYAELSTVAVAVSFVIALVFLAWIGWKLSVGRNWARMVLLILTLISIPTTFYEILQIAPVRPVIAGLKLVEQGIDLGVLYLLFFPGREFFKPLVSPTQP